jgi:hypothetical protein
MVISLLLDMEGFAPSAKNKKRYMSREGPKLCPERVVSCYRARYSIHWIGPGHAWRKGGQRLHYFSKIF